MKKSRNGANLRCYSLAMLILYFVSLLFLFLNQIGIFVLIGALRSREEASAKIYLNLLVLYCFIGFIKIFGFVWMTTLSWKLKNVGNEIDSPNVLSDNNRLNFSEEIEIKKQRTQRRTILFD